MIELTKAEWIRLIENAITGAKEKVLLYYDKVAEEDIKKYSNFLDVLIHQKEK